MRTAVIVFPGSNCDRDLAVALGDADRPADQRLQGRPAELGGGDQRLHAAALLCSQTPLSPSDSSSLTLTISSLAVGMFLPT